MKMTIELMDKQGKLKPGTYVGMITDEDVPKNSVEFNYRIVRIQVKKEKAKKK